MVSCAIQLNFIWTFIRKGYLSGSVIFHDAFPLAYLLKPDLFTFTRGHARIGTGELDRGQTAIAPVGSTMSPLWLEAPTVNVATRVDHAQLTQLFIDTYAL